jgi:cell division protein FtsQ
MRRSALSPRGTLSELEDLASRRPLIGGQRVDRSRMRRRIARRARRVAARAGLVALGLIGVAAVALLATWLLSSPRFRVATVEVRGQSRLSRDVIEAAADVPPGANIFTLNTREIAGRVEALASVRHATVMRTLPNRVDIVVEERRPFTLVHAGNLHWIDEHGIDLGPESRPVSLDTPVISGLDADDLGSSRAEAKSRAAVGITLLRLLRRSGTGLLPSISEIDVSRVEGPVLYTLDGVEVHLGREDWEARLGRLQGMLAQLKATGESVTAIDLRFRDQIVLKTGAR